MKWLLVLIPSVALAQYNPQNPDHLRWCESQGYSLYSCGTGNGVGVPSIETTPGEAAIILQNQRLMEQLEGQAADARSDQYVRDARRRLEKMDQEHDAELRRKFPKLYD